MTANSGDTTILSHYPRLHEKVFLYRYAKVAFLMDAREVREMPFARQQTSLNQPAARFLEGCDGTRRLGQYLEEFAQAGHYNVGERDRLLQFAQRAVNEGHLVLSAEPQSGPLNLFSLRGSSSGFPAHLGLELTYNCNLTCKHCYCGDYASTCYVDATALLQQLDVFVQNGTAVVELTGGEPLLHPRFPEILEYCLKNFLIVAVISNGTLFTEPIIEMLAQHRDKVVVSVSIDGPCAEVHDRIRGVPGSFDKAVATVRRLRERGIKVRLATVISKHNYRHVYEMAQLGQRLAVNWIAQTFLVPVGKGKQPDNLMLYEELQQAVSECERARHDFAGYYLEMEGRQLEEVQKHNCGAGWRTMAISPKGNIRPCVMADEDEFALGNIFKQQLSDIFARGFSQYFCNLPVPQPKICGDCRHIYFCQSCIVRPLHKIKEIGEACAWNRQNQYQQKLASYRQQA